MDFDPYSLDPMLPEHQRPPSIPRPPPTVSGNEPNKLQERLVQLMAWFLFGNMPLPEPMMVYCQLDPWKH